MKIYISFTETIKKHNCAVLFAAVIIVVFAFVFFTKRDTPPVISRSFFALGTIIHCDLRLFDEKEANRVFALISDEITAIQRMCDVNDVNSELSRLNAAMGNTDVSGGAERDFAVSEKLYGILKFSDEYARLTEGAFDYTLGALIDVWGMNDFDAGQPAGWKPPDPAEINAAREKCGYDKVTVIPISDNGGYYIKTGAKGLKINLGAVAKGYAERECGEILRKNRVSGLLNFGGNIQFVYPAYETFTLSVSAPDSDDDYTLLDCFVHGGVSASTSGAYRRYFEYDGVKYGHIFDSRTGRPAESVFAGVTVICGDPAAADVMSTAAFVSGGYYGYDHIGILKSGVVDSSLPVGRSAKTAAADGTRVVNVYVRGEIVKSVPLDTDTEFVVQGDGGYNVVSVRGGKVAVIEADCRDGLCMRIGYTDSLPIVCLPHKVEVVAA